MATTDEMSSYMPPDPSSTPVPTAPLEDWEKVPVYIYLQCHHPRYKHPEQEFSVEDTEVKKANTTTIDFPRIKSNVADTRTLWKIYDAVFNSSDGQELIMNYIIDIPYHFEVVMVKMRPDPRQKQSWIQFTGDDLMHPVAEIWTKEIIEDYQAINADPDRRSYGNPVIKVLVQQDRIDYAREESAGSTTWYRD